MRFVVKLGDVIVGFSELEGGDPSMGAAFGRFLPAPEYVSIRSRCINHRDWIEIPGLVVEASPGVPIECMGGVQIIDLSPELGEEGIQLNLNGITNPPYDKLFPNHVEAEKKRWGLV